MSGICEVCGKEQMKGHKVSFSNKKSNRHYKVNLQSTTVEENGTSKKIKACTKCKKTITKKSAN